MNDFHRLNQALLAQDVIRDWLPDGKKEGHDWVALNPTRDDRSPGSFRIHLDTGQWLDWATDDKGGDLISLYGYLHGLKNGEAAKAVRERYVPSSSPVARKPQKPAPKPTATPVPDTAPPLPPHPELGVESATWPYHNAAGQQLFLVARYQRDGQPKTFRPWTFREGRWVCQGLDEPRPLYRLPALLEQPDRPVLIAEGEKASDAAGHLLPNYLTTTSAHGAQSAQETDWEPLRGRSVLIWPDADQAGQTYLATVSRILKGLDCQIQVVDTTGLPESYDAADVLMEGWTAEHVCRRIREFRSEPEAVAPPEPAIERQDPYRGTDDANAELFLSLHGEDALYCPPWEKWLLWSGTHWAVDDRLDIDRLAADVPRLLYRSAADAAEAGQRRTIADLARKLEGTTKRSTMLLAARHRVVAHHSELNQGLMLLNCPNGTVDLESGRLRPHDRRNKLAYCLDVPYLPEATAPTWTRFLHDVFAGDEALIAAVQRAVGYSLTGDVREQVLLILFGLGANGKSVFLNVLKRLMGPLAWQAAASLLLQDKHQHHPTELADLFGKRLVICSETGKGRHLNEELTKQLTGGDAITARRMRENFWEFKPSHKLWLATNHRPNIEGTDHAIWRRIRLLPFTVKFTDDGPHLKDPLMEHKLLKEQVGILAWAVRGCLDWHQCGLTFPQAVQDATEQYRLDMDELGGWLSECCWVSPKATAKASELHASYAAWCGRNGEFAENPKELGMRLKERGFIQKRGKGGERLWRGIGLRAEE